MASDGIPGPPFGPGYAYKPPRTPNLSSVRRSGVHVYGWGRGDLGQLGMSLPAGMALAPQRIDLLDGKDVVHAACNMFNSAFISADGELYTTGSNDYGQLGSKGHEPSAVPQRVAALEMHKIRHVAAGQNHALAVTEQGALFSWGACEFGQLGQGSEGTEQPQPRMLKGSKELRFQRVAAGACHSLALTGSGHVYSFGQGTFGAVGQGDEENKSSPALIERLWPYGVVQVSCGDNHSAALSVDGRVFTFGRGKYGQCGHGDFKSVSIPAHVKSLQGILCTQVVCGGDHTLVLTAQGAVFSWGRNNSGQLGLGMADNTCRPNRIQALDGHVVVQIAAGLQHSAVLTHRNEVYTFGSGELGQLGLGTTTDQVTPKRVTALPNLPVLFISAGGDHVVAVLKSLMEAGEQVAVGPSPLRPHGAGCAPLGLPHLLELCESAAGDKASSKAIRDFVVAVEDVFTSPGFLAAGFSVPPSASQAAAQPPSQPPGLPTHQLDVHAISAVYQALFKVYNTDVVTALGNSCLHVLDRMERLLSSTSASSSASAAATSASSVHMDLLPALLVLLQNPLNSEQSGMGSTLMSRFVNILLLLPPLPQQVLAAWLARLPTEVLGGRVLRPLQRYLAWLAEKGYKNHRAEVLRAAQVVYLLYDAHEQCSGQVPLSEWHNKAVSDAANLREEYMIFAELANQGRANQYAGPPASLCQVPLLLTPEAKSRILQGEASVQKQHMVQSSAMSALMNGMPVNMVGLVAFLDIHVRRSHILHDSLQQIVSRPQDLKKPLRVTFISNGVPEEGLDEGGVSREFFQLLVAEIFKEDYGMFTYSDETRTFWFDVRSLETSLEFQLVGIVLGLAIYNGVILDVHFPLVVYKKLLGMMPTFADLKEVQPTLHRGLQQLMEFDGDVENTFCRTFEVEYDFFGETRHHELMPGGSSIPVTRDNRGKYVELYTRWLLVTSVERQFTSFAHGFHQVCGGPALSLFHHEELELLVCGLPHLDFHELEKGARYEGGYHKDHPTVRDFWSVVLEFNVDQKRRFLSFCTGCDRAPVGGLGQLVLVVQRSGPDTDRLPTSHTCFNVLLLPEYSTRAKMKDRLLVAIENAQGFGLQ